MTNPLNNFWETDLDGLPGAINGAPQGYLQQIQKYIFGKVHLMIGVDGSNKEHYIPGKIRILSLARRDTLEIYQDERVPGRLLTLDQVTEQ